MQVLQLRLKLVTQWIISKKQSIYNMVVDHLPIYRAIKEFVQSYIRHMTDIVEIAEKIIKQLGRDAHQPTAQTLVQLFYLIRQKQLVNIQEWIDKLHLLEDKYKVSNNADNRPFPDIFKDIDSNIEYYNQLRSKISMARAKTEQQQRKNTVFSYQNLQPNYYKEQRARQLQKQRPKQNQFIRQNQKSYEVRKNENIFKTYAQYNQPYQKSQDKKIKFINKFQQQLKQREYQNKYKRTIFQNQRKQDEKPRLNNTYNYASNSIKSQNDERLGQYSPYKLVNPKYSPYKQKTVETGQKIQPFPHYRLNTEPCKFDMPSTAVRNENYKQYKAQLYQQMLEQQKQLKNRIIANRLQLQESPLKKYVNTEPKEDKYSTADKYSYSTNSAKNREKDNLNSERKLHNYYSQQTNNQEDEASTYSSTKPGKKYQYLFEQDRTDYPLKQFYRQQVAGSPVNRNLNYDTEPKKTSKRQPLKSYKYHYENYLKNQVPNKYEPNRNYQDSLDNYDQLGKQLQIDMPVLFRDSQDPKGNLEHLLTDSLMSSKKWDDSGMMGYLNDENSEQDSLDNPDPLIRQTGKFKQFKYTDEDEPTSEVQRIQNELKPKNKNYQNFPLTIQKQISSQSKDLNMSFGKN